MVVEHHYEQLLLYLLFTLSLINEISLESLVIFRNSFFNFVVCKVDLGLVFGNDICWTVNLKIITNLPRRDLWASHAYSLWASTGGKRKTGLDSDSLFQEPPHPYEDPPPSSAPPLFLNNGNLIQHLGWLLSQNPKLLSVRTGRRKRVGILISSFAFSCKTHFF